jgi:hypothetical protein
MGVTPQVQAKIADAMEEKLRAAGEELLKEAQARVPVRTGALKRSLGLRIEREGNRVTVHIGSTLSYAKVVELDTERKRGTAYLRGPLYRAAWARVFNSSK